jgi:hypothetical protein
VLLVPSTSRKHGSPASSDKTFWKAEVGKVCLLMLVLQGTRTTNGEGASLSSRWAAAATAACVPQLLRLERQRQQQLQRFGGQQQLQLHQQKTATTAEIAAAEHTKDL